MLRLRRVAAYAVSFLSAALSGALPLHAADAPQPAALSSKLLAPLRWRNIGPFRGGRVLAVAGVPREPAHFYFGSVNGGVWETRDAGRTWRSVFDDAPVGSVGAIALAPSDARIIYVGTGEADMRSDIAQGAGLYKSVDAGRTWQPSGLEDTQQIARILVDPANPDIVLVAALGHPYGANPMRGVFRSVDGGKSWTRTLFKDADTGATDLAAMPGAPNIVFAALWQTRRPPWNVYPPSSGAGGGLYKSTDGGQSWTQLTAHGLPAHPGRIGIAFAPSEPQRVFSLIDAEQGGLYRSDDGGENWERVSDDRRIWGRGWYFAGVTVHPRMADVVYVCNTGVYRSDDGGKHFMPIKGAPGGDDYHELWIDPTLPTRRILGVDQGALVSLNGGATWSSWFNQPTGQFYHVVTDNRFPYWVYGAQQDSGAAGIPSRTDNIDGIELQQFREITAGGENDNVAPDPDDPEIIFGGRVDRLDLRTGQTRSVDPTLAYPDLYRGTWTLPLLFAPTAHHALYFANQRIFRTSDRGAHWDIVSPDLTREHPATPPNLDPATAADAFVPGARRGVVYSIGLSSLNEKILWAGTDDGLVWKSSDGGAHWLPVTPSALTDWSKVSAIEPSHFDAQSAYIAVDRHRLDDPQPYIYRTHDGGTTWTAIAAGIDAGPPVNSVNVVREDPLQRGLLYAGTERGVYVSIDDGAHWQPLQQNLPHTSVRDLTVHGDDLVIATHGRAFWIMDDVAPLRALAADASPATRLLPPTQALRVRPTGFTGTPMPKDEPMGANPPAGAYIDYVLDATAGSSPVMLTITDAHGARVRHFSSGEASAGPDLTKIQIAPEWIVPPEPLATGEGAHRFVWNLRYGALSALASDDPSEDSDGVWAPPGQYQLELSAGGHQYRQVLTLAPDPRVKLPASAYAREFEFARSIEAARVRVTKALAEAEKLHTALHAHTDGAPVSADAAAAMVAADQKLIAISDLAPAKSSPDSTGSPPSDTHGLRYLDGALKKLATAADSADAAPSTDLERGWARHQALLEHALGDWDRFKAVDMGQLNEKLKAAGAGAIVP